MPAAIDRENAKNDDVLGRILVLCLRALDPELTRETVIGRVKDIYMLVAPDDDDDDE